MGDIRDALSDVIETGDYLVDRCKALWRGGRVRDLAEAIGAWEDAKRTARALADSASGTASDRVDGRQGWGTS